MASLGEPSWSQFLVLDSLLTFLGKDSLDGLPERFARAIQARANRSDRDPQTRGDRLVIPFFNDLQDEDVPMLGSDFLERFHQLSK